MMKFQTIDQALTILQRDHALLTFVLEESPHCFGRKVGDYCEGRPCVNSERCSLNLRAGLFQLTNASVIRFRHEEEAMKRFNCSTASDHHREQHIDMAKAIQNAAFLYYRDYNYLGAIDEINHFNHQYSQHFVTCDTEMFMSH
jgi:hypothetical protein